VTNAQYSVNMVSNSLGGVTSRVSNINESVSGVSSQVDGVSSQVTIINANVNGVTTQIQSLSDLEQQLASTQNFLMANLTQLTRLQQELQANISASYSQIAQLQNQLASAQSAVSAVTNQTLPLLQQLVQNVSTYVGYATPLGQSILKGEINNALLTMTHSQVYGQRSPPRLCRTFGDCYLFPFYLNPPNTGWLTNFYGLTASPLYYNGTLNDVWQIPGVVSVSVNITAVNSPLEVYITIRQTYPSLASGWSPIYRADCLNPVHYVGAGFLTIASCACLQSASDDILLS